MNFIINYMEMFFSIVSLLIFLGIILYIIILPKDSQYLASVLVSKFNVQLHISSLLSLMSVMVVIAGIISGKSFIYQFLYSYLTFQWFSNAKRDWRTLAVLKKELEKLNNEENNET